MPRAATTLAFLLCFLHPCMLTECNGQVADGYLRKWVTKNAQEMNSRLVPGAFQTLGWASSIRQSLDLAKKHDRLVFLFTLDGDLDSGRC